MSTTPWSFPGSRWWKFDFHAHTPASSDYGAGPDQATLQRLTPHEWLLNYIRAGIECVAITDHNCGDWIDPLKTELAKMRAESIPGANNLHLFPGVELTINGAHYLAIFDPSATTQTIRDLLAVARYNNAARNADGYCAEDVPTICREVLARDGVFVPAHVDCGMTGCFKQSNLSAIEPILKLGGILAMEVVSPSYTPPAAYTDAKLTWTRLLGSDAHHPSAPTNPVPGQAARFPGSHWTWVKMGPDTSGALTIEALKLALLDGNGVSIRRSDDPEAVQDPNTEPEEAIESIEVSSARVMGNGTPEKSAFSPWLNALVGGRGTGKSTFVHFMRLALRREGELEKLGPDSEALQTFNRFRKVGGGVRPETKVRLVFRHQGGRYRLNWSPEPSEQPDTEEWDETQSDWRPATSQEIVGRFPVRIFSQGQIAALAGERSAPLMEIIDQAVDFREWKTRWDEQERAFFVLRAKARELKAKLQNRDRIVGQLDDVRRKLTRFEEAEHAKVLREFQQRGRQAREVERQFQEVEDVAGRIEAFSAEIFSTDVGEGIFDSQDAIGAQAMQRIAALQQVVSKAAEELRAIASKLKESVSAQRGELDQTEWIAQVKSTKAAYDKLVSELQAQGVSDPSEYGRLVQDRQRLEGEVKALDTLAQSLESVTQGEQTQLNKLRELRREISRKRAEFLANTLAADPYVRIELEPYGREPEAIAEKLREVLGLGDEPRLFLSDIYARDDNDSEVGIVADLLQDLPRKEVEAQEELERRIEALKQGLLSACAGQTYSKIGKRLQDRLRRSSESRPEFTDRLLTWYPDDTLSVSFSRDGKGGNFESIQRGSAGQKAAAMLAFFLKYGNEPIILDQPEDDLDNHLIYSLVVQQLRQTKSRRQIITVTHNPNIVVNGDAEMVHAMDFRSGQCRIVEKGGLQDGRVREEVCRVMEGGREAFEKRYQRLGKGGQHV